MAIAIHGRGGLTRRQLLVRSASTMALAGLGSLAKPYLSRAADRPQIAGGIQSGDVSADSAGQGWGIDPARGGMRSYRTMLNNRPDFFIHSGDHIYADCPVERELKLPNGEIWRNIVTEQKSVVAQTLEQFRGNYKYNLLDENFRAFHAQVPMLAQWDDHEVTNDWS